MTTWSGVLSGCHDRMKAESGLNASARRRAAMRVVREWNRFPVGGGHGMTLKTGPVRNSNISLRPAFTGALVAALQTSSYSRIENFD